MDLRKIVGGMIEAELNKLVDKHLNGGELSQKVAELVEKELSKLLKEDLGEKLKANLIDKIDGEDDIADV